MNKRKWYIFFPQIGSYFVCKYALCTPRIYPRYTPDLVENILTLDEIHRKYEQYAPLPHHRVGSGNSVFLQVIFDKYVCSTVSCHKTESAHELLQILDCSGSSQSAAFPHSARWHIVTDSSLIIPRQWRSTCQFLQVARRLGWSWIPLAPCDVSTRMGSCPTGDLIWTLVGANPTSNYRATSHRATCSPPPLPAQEKHQSWR